MQKVHRNKEKKKAQTTLTSPEFYCRISKRMFKTKQHHDRDCIYKYCKQEGLGLIDKWESKTF